jgi:hypothetical protein
MAMPRAPAGRLLIGWRARPRWSTRWVRSQSRAESIQPGIQPCPLALAERGEDTMSRPYAGAEIGDRQADRAGQAVRFARRCDFVKDAFGPVVEAAMSAALEISSPPLVFCAFMTDLSSSPTQPEQSITGGVAPSLATLVPADTRHSWYIAGYGQNPMGACWSRDGPATMPRRVAFRKKADGACRSQNRLSASGYDGCVVYQGLSAVPAVLRDALMTERLLPAAMIPRLLSREAAATYYGMSPNLFEQHLAPAVPSVRVDNRNLWDIRALDRRLDQQSGLAQATRPDDEWAGSRAARRKRTGPGHLSNAVLGAATDGIKVGIALGIYGALHTGDAIRFRWPAVQWTLARFGVVLGHRRVP